MDWTPQEVAHVVPEEASYAMIVISLGHASGTLSFDDLMVTVMEEGERDYSLNWKRLFNGRDIDDWKVIEEHRKYWTVADGILTCEGREGSAFSVALWWPEPVGDFELRFSYKLEGAQAGDKHNAVFFYRSNKQDGYRLALIREGVLGLLSERGMLNSHHHHHHD